MQKFNAYTCSTSTLSSYHKHLYLKHEIALPRMYRLSLVHKIEKTLSPKLVSRQSPHYGIGWCLYHVPKTAGSSLRQSFINSFGERAVFGIYRNTGANSLRKGKPIWIPKRSSVVFGHLPTHENHQIMFPNAKKITWVREPLERVWSLLRHYFYIGEQSPQYNTITELYINKGIFKKEAIFERILKDKLFSKSTHVYSNYFAVIPLSEFDFVGSVNRNTEDLTKLQKLLGKSITESNENIRNSKKTFPESLRYLEKELEAEYEIVSDYL